jgi:hypothetical protein
VKSRAVLSDPVRELVRQYIDGLGEAFEDVVITVTEDQMSSIPERVVVVPAVVHGCQHRAAAVID